MKAISSDDSVLGTNEAFAVLAVWLAERKILCSNAFFFVLGRVEKFASAVQYSVSPMSLCFLLLRR